MNIEIKNILDNDDKLYNRVRAYGPGDGINRWCVVVEDQDSIDLYGLRETGQSFPAAVDVDDLRTRAEAYLEDVSTPTQEVVFTYYFDTGIVADDVYYNGQLLTSGGKPVKAWTSGNDLGIKRGDTLRVVSKSLGQAFTGTVEELDWSPGEVEVRLGQPAYNLLDVINGPEKDEEREETALGLPAPIGVRAFRAQPGVSLTLNPYSNSRAIGVEVYISSDPDDLVAPSRAYLARKSPGTRFDFPELESGAMWYFRVRSYDAKGDVSDWADTVSAIGGYVDGGRIEPGTIDITPIASGLKPPRNVLNLPDVDIVSGYDPGDLVVYDDGDGPRLYELIEEPTGDPNTDWQVLSVEELRDKKYAHQVVAGTIEVGAIGADEIAANAITASKMRITGDSNNVIADPNFDDREYWRFIGPEASYGTSTRNYIDGYAYLGLGGDETYPRLVAGDFLRVQGGGSWYFEADIQPDSPSANLNVGIKCYDSDKNFLEDSWCIRVDKDSGASWNHYRGSTDLHPDTAYAMIAFQSTRGTSPSGGWYVANPVVRRRSDENLIVDGAISTDKLKAGNVVIDDTGGSTGEANAVRVYNSSTHTDANEVLRLGNISNKDGVPSGTDWGLWGVLGSGVFIQGAPRIINVGWDSMNLSYSGEVEDGDMAAFLDSFRVMGECNIESGKSWIVVPHFTEIGSTAGRLMSYAIRGVANPYGIGGATQYNIIPSGHYSYVDLQLSVRLESRGHYSGIQFQPEFMWMILEI